jgi:nucleoside-diphosphate-sugar epimerase
MGSLTIFVTGATGVVARRLIPRLVQEGHRVIAMSHDARKRQRLEATGAAVVDADLFKVESLRRAVAGCDAVVNLATHMPPNSMQMLRRSSWAENDRIRSEGSSNLVEAALAEGVGRFIQESFAPVYPDCGDRWIEEDMPLKPVRYNESIVDAEQSAQRFGKSGATGIVLRFAAFYGPDSRFLMEGIQQVRAGKEFLPGSPEAYVSSVHHDDAASAAAAALHLPAGVYNVADDDPLTRREYFESLARALGVPAPKPQPFWTKWLLGSLGELLSRSEKISNRRLKAASSWAPKFKSVREGWPDVIRAVPAQSGSAAA